jgi:N4-gp56 family major capsid protein
MAKGSDGETAEGLSGAPICLVSDLEKMGGDTVTFTNYRVSNQKARLGEQELMGNESNPKFGKYDVTIDNVRVGTAWTRKLVRQLAKKGQVVSTITDMTHRDLDLKIRDFCLQRWVERSALGRNLVFPDPNKSSVDALRSTDTFSTDTIENVKGILSQNGAKAISSRKLKNGATVPNYLFFGPQECLKSLNKDSAYRTANQYAADRGAANVLFAGGYNDWDGQKIWHWEVVREDTTGPIGTYLNPMAECGEAIAPANTAITLRGGGMDPDFGGSLPSDHFRYFPSGNQIGHQFEGEVRLDNQAKYYVKAVVQTGADKGKWCLYRYTGNANAGTGIVIDQRLGNAVAGIENTTVGNVVFNATYHTETIPQGSMFYLANAWGEVIGNVLAVGSDSLLLAYGGGAMGEDGNTFGYDPKGVTAISGMARGKGTGAGDDYGMKQALAAEGVFGVDVPKNSQGQFMNHVVIPVVYVPPTGGGLVIP